MRKKSKIHVFYIHNVIGTLKYYIIYYRIAVSIFYSCDVSTIDVHYVHACVCAFIFRFGVSSRVSATAANTRLNMILYFSL